MEDILVLMVALSVAAERLVEITRGFIPVLNEPRSNESHEKARRAVLQLLAAVSGVIVVMLAEPVVTGILPEGWNSMTGLLVLGLLASGGSGLWNAILSTLTELKGKLKYVQQSAAEPASKPSALHAVTVVSKPDAA